MQKVHRVYFDSASTTNVNPDVLSTYESLLAQDYCNSESLYDEGIAIHHKMEKARAAAAGLLGVKSDEIIFTSGSSEANSSAIKGVTLAQKGKNHIVTSCVEHSSILNACRQMERLFHTRVDYLPVGADGRVSVDDVKKAVDEDTAIVSIMYVNNESGAINPIPEIADYVRHHTHAYMHVDLTQAVGKVDLDLSNIDLASISAHKLEGLKGSGILVKKGYVPFEPLINGGEQEFGIRGGTANAVADMVFAKTLRLALENGRRYHAYIKGMHDQLIAGLKQIPGIEINSPEDGVVSTINFSYEDIPSEVMQNALNQKGFMVSARSTCDSRSDNPSYVLLAMGYSRRRASSCIRVSLSRHNTPEEIDAFLSALKEITKQYGKV
ncbi:MAG: cysteine desulfurase [Erysipelotrichaceae bacterium]|nr:cysteine desulfurase [Erysipelotrichaceae bacterium]MCI1326425.1 cysteine desulfurase [Solobacterium sp.]MCH4045137.1 cysteine desulfurase [Erysipelotrichaceae bacterium]MCH4122348.1 cysteine desulfurase [Erysipelotrichaceae bacterium]MCI1363018.1 cysteine desulfurase [Solobacterium sp.]